MTDDNEKKQFIEACGKSDALKLLVPEPKNAILHLGKETGAKASIAFLAFKRGQLSKLDDLINKYRIVSRGIPAFKGKLKEHWLEKKGNNRKAENIRKAENNPLSALSELMVADYLDQSRFEIINLEAWDEGCKSDIEC